MKNIILGCALLLMSVSTAFSVTWTDWVTASGSLHILDTVTMRVCDTHASYSRIQYDADGNVISSRGGQGDVGYRNGNMSGQLAYDLFKPYESGDVYTLDPGYPNIPFDLWTANDGFAIYLLMGEPYDSIWINMPITFLSEVSPGVGEFSANYHYYNLHPLYYSESEWIGSMTFHLALQDDDICNDIGTPLPAIPVVLGLSSLVSLGFIKRRQ